MKTNEPMPSKTFQPLKRDSKTSNVSFRYEAIGDYPDSFNAGGRAMNLCRACGENFGSVAAFDAHRVGKHAYDYSPQRPDGRRCLSVKEVRKKFKLNSREAWSTSTFLKGSDGT